MLPMAFGRAKLSQAVGNVNQRYNEHDQTQLLSAVVWLRLALVSCQSPSLKAKGDQHVNRVHEYSFGSPRILLAT